MLCEHLRAVEAAVTAAGARETFRGQAWTDNCREWVYVDQVLPIDAFRADGLFDPAVVAVHDNADSRSGSERGLVCTVHHNGLMGPRPH